MNQTLYTFPENFREYTYSLIIQIHCNIYTYNQKLVEEIHSGSACVNYRILTIDPNMQNYLLLLPRQFSNIIRKFKCGNHILPVLKGRYNNINLEDILCPSCSDGDPGDEIHYLFKCNFFFKQ